MTIIEKPWMGFFTNRHGSISAGVGTNNVAAGIFYV